MKWESPEMTRTSLSINFQQEWQDNSIWKTQSLQQMVLRQLDSHMQKNEVDFLSHMITQQWSKDSNVRARIIILWEENRIKSCGLALGKLFFNMTPKALLNKNMKKLGFIEVKAFALWESPFQKQKYFGWNISKSSTCIQNT